MTAIHWKNAASGPFNTAADWNPGSTPGAADDAIIDAIGTYTVTSSVNTTVNTVDTIGGATLAIAAGTTFQATNGGVNAGKITPAHISISARPPPAAPRKSTKATSSTSPAV